MDQAQDTFAVVGNSTGMDTCGVKAGGGLSDVRGSCPNRLAWRLHCEAYSVPTGTRISITNCPCFNPRHSEQTLFVSLHEILFLLDQSCEESPSLARIICIAAAIVEVLNNPCNELECKLKEPGKKTVPKVTSQQLARKVSALVLRFDTLHSLAVSGILECEDQLANYFFFFLLRRPVRQGEEERHLKDLLKA